MPASGVAPLYTVIGRALRADLRAGERRMAARRFVDFWNGAGSVDALASVRRYLRFLGCPPDENSVPSGNPGNAPTIGSVRSLSMIVN